MMACPDHADAAFGPRVEVVCREFDFTLYFQDLFFACLPAGIFLLFFPVSVWLLWRETRRIQRSSLLLFKLVTLIALFVCQTTFLVMRQLALSSTVVRTDASLPADLLEVLTILCAALLSYIHHCRSIRPSTLLTLFFSARSLIGIARVRSLWLIRPAAHEAIVFTLGFVFTLLSTVLESYGKASSILETKSLKPATPEPFSGFWKLASFAWLAGTFRQGYTKVLSVCDLPDLDPRLESEVVGHKLHTVWSETGDKTTKYGLLWACVRAYPTSFVSAVIPRLFLTGFTFCQPFLITATVAWVGMPGASIDSGKGLIGAWALAYTGKAIFTALYGYQTFRFTTRLRGGLIALVHQQTLQTRTADMGEITAITLMGTDVERIVSGFQSIHDLWGGLMDIGIAVYLLERQIGVACVVPGIIVVSFISYTFKMSAASNILQRVWVEKVEERLRLTSYALENIKAVKMLGLSEKMFSLIRGLRSAEIAASAAFRRLLVVRVVLSNSPADVAPMATFAVYVIIAIVKKDNSILAVQAFTSLSLISLVTGPVLVFIQALPAVIQCMGSFARIQEYCTAFQLSRDSRTQEKPRHNNSSAISLQELPKPTAGQNIVTFRGQTLGWDRKNPVLQNIRLNIRAGVHTMIVGPVGSGKSTLLESILGETLATNAHGDPERNFASVAYCSQIPWLQSQSVRRNIIGAMPVDAEWYAKVVWACGLESDLAELGQGDQTLVGSNGLALSGGQKQRIALARAIYSRCKVVLLDDVFSGVDATAMDVISRRLFGENGLCRIIQATVVLATHSSFLLQYADDVVVLNDSRVAETGSLETLTASSAYIQSLKVASPVPEVDIEPEKSPQPTPSFSDSHGEGSSVLEKGTDEQSDESTRQMGDFSVYLYYAFASGGTAIIGSLIGSALWAFCRGFPTVWLDWWTAANATDPNSRVGMYLGVYILIGCIGLVLLIVVSWLVFVNIVSNSASRLHDDLLTSTMRAPFQFFHRVDIGSITNRFSQDMDLVDMALPIDLINSVTSSATCLVKLIILAVYAKYLAIAIPPLAVILYVTQKFYLRTSRQLRLLDIEAKAPLYTHFLELGSGGAATIRAFGWQNTFAATCISLLNLSQRPVYLLLCVQHCLGFFLDMVVTVMAAILVSIIVFRRDGFDPGDVGVALVMVMTFNVTLMQLIKSWTTMETSIGAVSRVKSFVATTEAEEDAVSPPPPPPADWPSQGAIQLSDVVVGHSATSLPVLKGISMSILAGEKIAICGPSGSGKTTLILTLLRMVELQHGSLSIDGLDLVQYSRGGVRAALNVVTQDPFLVTGTVRFNIDPFQSASDDDITTALQKLHLWEKIETEGGLDMAMKPTSWSVGQRQLLCLARAMVRRSRVLVLDEATSSVDNETEKTMQDVIEREFAGHTILSVVHRLGFIRRYDRVALLDGGVLVEFDKPEVLLSRPSRFAELYHAGSNS